MLVHNIFETFFFCCFKYFTKFCIFFQNYFEIINSETQIYTCMILWFKLHLYSQYKRFLTKWMKSNVKFKIIIWVYNGMLKARLQLYMHLKVLLYLQCMVLFVLIINTSWIISPMRLSLMLLRLQLQIR